MDLVEDLVGLYGVPKEEISRRWSIVRSRGRRLVLWEQLTCDEVSKLDELINADFDCLVQNCSNISIRRIVYQLTENWRSTQDVA